MLIQKRILCAERVRRVPVSFSYVDHRLVRGGYLKRADAKAWALYPVSYTHLDVYKRQAQARWAEVRILGPAGAGNA